MEDPERRATTSAVPARGILHPHRLSLIVGAVGIALTLVLAIGSSLAIQSADSRLVTAQAKQVAAALQAAIPATQQPLIDAARVASSLGTVHAFRQFVGSEVGAGAPFHSISLWRETGADPRLLSVVGERPRLLARASSSSVFLRGVHPSPQLQVIGLLSGPAKRIGYAEMPPGSPRGLFVYAESTLPTSYPSDSPFSGLRFVLYLGAAPSPANVMGRSTPSSASGRTATMVVPFGNTAVTVVATLTGRPTVLPQGLPLGILAVGLSLSAAAGITAERLARRRDAAESMASDTEQRYDAQRSIASTLQQALLPEDDLRFPGVELAMHYVPGVQQLDVGGDWYDAIRVDDDHLFVTVGDVSGRGLQAATIMGSLRHAIRAYAVQGDDPAVVLAKLDELVSVERDGRFATVLCALLDVPRRTLSVASAGHPPPLVVDASGAHFVRTDVSSPVGVRSSAPPVAQTITVSKGTTFLAYTDGLVERRDRSLDDGLEGLRNSVAGHRGSVDDLVRHVVSTILPDGTDDDVAIFGVRWPMVVADDPPVVTSRHFERDLASIRQARLFVTTTLPDVAQEVVESAALLVSELATNALVHAHTGFDVTVTRRDAAHEIRVDVADSGAGLPVRRPPETPTALGGRGLELVQSLSERWGVEQLEHGRKSVWFELAVPVEVPIRLNRPGPTGA